MDRAHARGADDDDPVDRPVPSAGCNLGLVVDMYVRPVGLELAVPGQLGQQRVTLLFERGEEEEVDRRLCGEAGTRGGVGGHRKGSLGDGRRRRRDGWSDWSGRRGLGHLAGLGLEFGQLPVAPVIAGLTSPMT